MKKKTSIVVAILLLAVGFAAISTTLVINGNTSVGENTEDFDVIFTSATLDGTDVYNTVIDSTKKIINFTTSDLKTLNQTSVLTYEVTNNSSNYDAEVVVNCKVKDNTTAKYTSIENILEGNATKILAKETLNGTLTVTLNKTATEEVTEEYTCTITANAKERDEIGKITYYYAYGIPTTASTTDYKTLGKNVFMRLDENGTKSICINDNGLFCIKPDDNGNSVSLLKKHFGEDNCNDGSGFYCWNDSFQCTVDGGVICEDKSVKEACMLDDEGINHSEGRTCFTYNW